MSMTSSSDPSIAPPRFMTPSTGKKQRFWPLLTGNDRLRPLCCGSALHYNRADEVASILPDYRPTNVQGGGLIAGTEFTDGHFPAMFWMERRE